METVVIIIVIYVAFALVAAVVAKSKGMAAGWAIASLLLTPLVILVLSSLPPVTGDEQPG